METRVLTLFDDDDFLPKKDSGKKPSKKIAAVVERVETQPDAGNEDNDEPQGKTDTLEDSVTVPATPQINATASEPASEPEKLDGTDDAPGPDMMNQNAEGSHVYDPSAAEPGSSLSEEKEEISTQHITAPKEVEIPDEPVYIYEAVDIITEEVYADIQEADEPVTTDESDEEALQPAAGDLDTSVVTRPAEDTGAQNETLEDNDEGRKADDELSRQMFSELIQLDYTALLHRDFPAAPLVQNDKEIRLHVVEPGALSEEASIDEQKQVQSDSSTSVEDNDHPVPDMLAGPTAEAGTAADQETPQQEQAAMQEEGSENRESRVESSVQQVYSDVPFSEGLIDDYAGKQGTAAMIADELLNPDAEVEAPADVVKYQVDEGVEEMAGTHTAEPGKVIPAIAQGDIAEESGDVADPLPEWKLEKNYYAIGEVAALFGVNTSHIRFWTNEFKLKPRTTRKGDRLYNAGDIAQLRLIHHLVKERKHTIKGAKEKLKAEKDKVNNKLDLKDSLIQLRDLLVHIRNQI
jgi:DNA-binding transcriptional MerR regulator